MSPGPGDAMGCHPPEPSKKLHGKGQEPQTREGTDHEDGRLSECHVLSWLRPKWSPTKTQQKKAWIGFNIIELLESYEISRCCHEEWDSSNKNCGYTYNIWYKLLYIMGYDVIQSCWFRIHRNHHKPPTYHQGAPFQQHSQHPTGGSLSTHAEVPQQIASTRAVRAKPQSRHSPCCDAMPLFLSYMKIYVVPPFEDPFVGRTTLKIHPSFPDVVSSKNDSTIKIWNAYKCI